MTDSYKDILKKGGVVAFPTETVYGLGASAFEPDAIKKVFQIKGRPSDNPLIVHISDMDMVDQFVNEISEDAKTLMKAFWPGPLTFVLYRKPEVLDLITAGLSTVALRMPDHEQALQLIREAGPLVAPSANLSGKPSPTRAEHVKHDFGVNFPVVDGGPCQIGLESTVIDMTSQPYTILRPGDITSTSIESILGKKVVLANHEDSSSPKSPGMKYSHYSPRASVRWLGTGEQPDDETILYLYPASEGKQADNAHIKSYGNDIQAFARDLYDRFRQADLMGYREIAIERFGHHDALLNRIEKAIGKA